MYKYKLDEKKEDPKDVRDIQMHDLNEKNPVISPPKKVESKFITFIY